MFSIPISATVKSKPIYTPEHQKDGVLIKSRIKFRARVYTPCGKKVKGRKTRKTRIVSLIALGKTANILCTALSPFRRIECVVTPSIYTATFKGVTVTKVTFTINRIILGEEHHTHIMTEIMKGYRPAYWNTPTHSDRSMWQEFLRIKGSNKYRGGRFFGFAKVVQPKISDAPPKVISKLMTPF